MATLPPLLTPEQFSVGTNGQIAASDPRVPALLAGASAAVRRYCGWHIAPVLTEEDVLLDGSGGSVLRLPTLRLRALLALHNHTTELDVDAAEWSTKGLVRLRHSHWTDRYRGVRASYIHGYDLDEVPDLQQIVQQVVGHAISSPLGATREQAGSLAVQWATTAPGVSGGLTLLERDYAILNSYRLEAAS